MHIIKNEGYIDRLIRILLAVIFFIGAFFWVGGIAQIVLYVAAVAMLITGVLGFCSLYALFGIRTIFKGDEKPSKIVMGIFAIVIVATALVGSYYSNFFTKKFFLDDYSRMNNFYKQTLFNTGQDKRAESIANYDALVSEYAVFVQTYTKYHPYVISYDSKFNSDLDNVKAIISGLHDAVYTGNLPEAHKEFEAVRPIFQDILKRNGFSMLAVYLVDFHDAMEKIIAASDAKDATQVITVYAEVDEKLKEVESVANDAEIQVIRNNLEAVLTLAREGKSDALSAKAAELKSSFVKVYLKRG